MVNAFKSVANTPEEDRLHIPCLEVVPRVSFFPDIPAVNGEDKQQCQVRAGLAMQTFKSKQTFDKKGKLTNEYAAWGEPAKFLAESVATRKQGQHRIGSAMAASRSQKVVDGIHEKMTSNAASVMQLMEVNNYPAESRQLISEALHDATKSLIGECEFLSNDILLLTFAYCLKTGRGLARLGAALSEKGARMSNVSGPVRKHERFEFDPSRFPAQVQPAGMKDARLCYSCVNRLVASGKLAVGDNPPANLWFDGIEAYNKHHESADCLNPKRASRRKFIPKK